MSAHVELGKIEERVLSSERWIPTLHSFDNQAIASVLPTAIRDGHRITCYPSATTSPNASVAVLNGTTLEPENLRTDGESQWYSKDCVWLVDNSSYSALQLSLEQLLLDKLLVNI